MSIDPATQRYSLSNWLRIGLGLAAGVVFVYLALKTVSLAEVYALVAEAAVAPLVLATLAFGVDFLLRAVRFWLMLQLATERKLPLSPVVAPFIASFGISDVLPLRVGDGFRAVWFSRHFAIPMGTVIGTMVVERILDLVSIVLLGALALALLDANAPALLVWNFQLILAFAAVAGCALLFAPAILCRLLERLLGRFDFAPVRMLVGMLRNTTAAVAQIGSWRRVVWLSAMSVALWILESLVLIGAWISLGGAADALLKPFTTFVFSTLGTLAPSLPGHFGSFEYFGIQAFALTGVEGSMAAAVVLLGHLILWAPTAIFGVGWLLLAAPRNKGDVAAGH